MDAHYRARAEAVLGVDDLVQNVVSTLKASGELKNTVLIFTSDNGFFHGEHRVPAGKVRLYEPSIRVPLLIRGPGVPKGVHRRQPVGNVDLAPTILDFAKAKPGRKEDGVSLLPLMRNKRDWLGRAMDLETYFTPDDLEDPEDPPLDYQGVRTDRYLYAQYGNGEQELYDLRTDPFELQNQAGNPVFAQDAGRAGEAARLGSAMRGKDLPRAAGGQAEGALLERQGRRQGQAAGGDLLSARQEGQAGCQGAHPSPGCRTRLQARSWRRW